MTANTPDVKMIPVTSSQILAVGHNPNMNLLRIQFKGKGGTPGSVYEYPNVTSEQHQALITAPSIGKHFGTTIKNNSAHPHRKIS